MREARHLPTDNHQPLTGHTAANAPSHRNLRMSEGAAETCDPSVTELIQQMLLYIGENPEREGLQRTPQRVAKSLDFLTSGYNTSIADVLNEALFETDSEEMVIVKDIEFYSLCEHHLLPFFGKIHVGYIPNGHIIGLSKIARVIDVFARRLQVQEHLTNQIADAMMDILDAKGVAVVSEASHLCMMMRGVQRQNSTTIASAMRGLFKFDRPTRNEFLQAVRT